MAGKLAKLESEKYAKCWELPEYHNFSPGEQYADFFVSVVSPKQGATILDAGCGAGAGGRALSERGYKVSYCDHVKVSDSLAPYYKKCLWKPLNIPRVHHVYCCDVLEHLPTQFVFVAVNNLLDICGSAFFSVSFVPDAFGAVVGETLHQTVRDFNWWVDSFSEISSVLNARDLLGEGVFHVTRT